MPYHIGSRGSNGCSGYPVVSDAGNVAGCHPTETEANAQLAALYANVADAGKSENPVMPTPTYQKCECEICVDQNLKCSSCPECQSGMDSEMEMAAYDASIGKGSPCWDGYVQRGMKPGANGKPVPNCVPVTKSSSIFAGLGKDYTRSTTNTYRTEK